MDAGGASGSVSILLPLSGKLGEIGKPMLRAARLALPEPGSPILVERDTGGTPEGAAAAARLAIAQGAKMILGPLTSAETASVGPIALRAGVPVLAFTNDSAQSRPGIWTLGITPGQQIRRLLTAVQATGREPVAALLPDTDFGRAMADGLRAAVASIGQPPPAIRMYGPGKDSIAEAVADLASTASPDQPKPFGSILLGATGGELKILAKAFADNGIDRSKVQILGPALWVDPASGSTAMAGGWFAMPDPDARLRLSRDYAAKYKESPPPRADLAHDAGAIARVLGSQGRMNAGGLTQPAGFVGADGWLGLSPDGRVRRGLAVFRVDRLRATKIGPAPNGETAPGS